MTPMKSINPATQAVIATYTPHTKEEVDQALTRSAERFKSWRQTSFEERAELMRKAADVLRESTGKWARLMTQEMGKTLVSATAEVEKCAWVCDFYADRAEALLTPQLIKTDASLSMRRFDPLGPLLAVMPWNFPFWQVFRFAAPYLMAGNTGLLKHASNTQGCALAIEQVFKKAGFPDDVFQTLVIGSDLVEEVIADSRIRGVTITGSEPAGRAVGEQAGRHLKPSVLELGGSDPFIVLADADLKEAATQGARSRLINAGQSCIAAKRFIVEDAVYDDFLDHFAQALRQQVVGDPMQEETDVGPMAREDLRDDLHEQLQKSVDQGARLVFGGEFDPDATGFYYPVTLLAEVTEHHTAFEEETFGPLAPVIRAKDATDAIRLANASDLGLGANLWTEDLHRALALVPHIESGHVAVNGIVKSDPRLPFGGVKNSGYGRELAQEGILAFMNTKTVWIK